MFLQPIEASELKHDSLLYQTFSLLQVVSLTSALLNTINVTTN